MVVGIEPRVRTRRREFLKRNHAETAVKLESQAFPLKVLTTIPEIQNPLEHFPSLGWNLLPQPSLA